MKQHNPLTGRFQRSNIIGVMYKAYCPSCKFEVYSTKEIKRDRFQFSCTCGCRFNIDIQYAKKV